MCHNDELIRLAALDLFPDASVLHLGLFRDKITLQAIEFVMVPLSRREADLGDRYYSKLPTNVTVDLVFVLDRESLSYFPSQRRPVRPHTQHGHTADGSAQP